MSWWFPGASAHSLDPVDEHCAGEYRLVFNTGPGAGLNIRADIDAQLAVADLDVSGGHLEDAFGRLLDAFPGADPEGRETIRGRLLDYFEIAGVDDPRVVTARARLTGLLY